MEFSIELATADDDPAIRHLLATNPIPGRVSVTYEREPDYFLGCGTMGRFHQVAIARHCASGAAAGVGCRAARPLFLNGHVEEAGYLGQLRVDRGYRGRGVLSLGMRYLKQLHVDARVAGYVTTIIEDNVVARRILVDGKHRHFPTYREVDRVYTLALILRRSKAALPSPYAIRRGSDAHLGTIIAFLKRHGPAKQFFPVYSEEDFRDSPTTLGFQVEDFVLACQNGEVVGVLGIWDQSAYKQTVVHAYTGALRWGRHLYSTGARLAGAQPLPAPGQPIHFAYASFICVAENNPAIFRVLLRHAYNLAAERGYAFLMVGLTASDPLLPVAREYAHISYTSRLYTVSWDEGDFHERLDNRTPYVEIAAL